MAEGTYDYECMRAELLGVEKPSYEDWLQKQTETEQVITEEQDVENLKEIENEEEAMRNITGRLDELNSILQVTQKKINKFKASCSSFTGFLKVKLGSASSSEPVKSDSPETNGGEVPVEPAADNSGNDNPRKSDLSRALDNHVDRFDPIIEKAENAQYSMAHQTKQMKRFLD